MAKEINRNIRDSLTEVGFVKKSRGVEGGMMIIFDNEPTFIDDSLEFIFLEIDGLPVPFPLLFMEERNDAVFYTELEFISDKEEAQKYAGCKVLVENKHINDQIDSLNASVLKGFSLFDTKLGSIGIVSEINDYAGNLVFTVIDDNKKEHLVPFNEELLVKFDADKSVIEMNCPKGIF
jgi:16S rRNA processing protein RimM